MPCAFIFIFFSNGSPSLKCDSVPFFFKSNLLFHAMRIYFNFNFNFFSFFSQIDRNRSNTSLSPFFKSNLLFHAMRVYFYFFLKRIAIAHMRVRPLFLSKLFAKRDQIIFMNKINQHKNIFLAPELRSFDFSIAPGDT